MVEQRLPIIGSGTDPAPIEPVLRAAFAVAGLDVAIERWEPRPHQLGPTLAKVNGRSYLGAVITSPHKEKAAALVASLSEDARACAAVNVVVRDGQRLRGHNTDIDGIRAGLEAILPRVHGRWPRGAMVLGAGGGARAAVTVLIGSGFQHVTVFNRHLHKAEALVADLARAARHMELRARPWHETIMEVELGKAGLLVNAIGADEDAGTPVAPELLPDGLFLLDLALDRSATALMRDVRERGGTVANGHASFLASSAATFRLLTGLDPSPDVMREALVTAVGDRDEAPALLGD